MSTNYPSDLTEGQWQVVRRGLPWRVLSRDFPKQKSAYTVFWL